jgi:hypothetical protein
MFSILGVLLAGYGLATQGSPIYDRSLGQNVNLEWGAVLIVFGLAMLGLAWRARGRG